MLTDRVYTLKLVKIKILLFIQEIGIYIRRRSNRRMWHYVMFFATNTILCTQAIKLEIDQEKELIIYTYLRQIPVNKPNC